MSNNIQDDDYIHAKMDNNSIIKSISFDEQDIIKNILKLHAPSFLIELDATYSTGNFYKKGLPQPKYKFDLFPQTDDTVKADSRDIPLPNAVVNTIMFDPPFVISYGPSTKEYQAGRNIIRSRFGGFNSVEYMWQYYSDSLLEFYRLFLTGGIVIFKCQDTISSSKQYLSHVTVCNKAQQIGFYVKDLFILMAKNRIISGMHHKQQHARKFHSYYLVLKKL